MTDTPQVAAARIEAERTRARLMSTAQELQERISPRTLARDAWEGAKSKGADLTEDAVDAVRARPVASGGAVAAIAILLARRPLMNLAGKVANGVTGKNRKARKKSKSKDTETVE
ncbi:uncharacterized protein DUF3618 [Sphingomonas sp. F9_3S_D5_B_2]